MKPLAIEHGNRRAEIEANFVIFLLCSGNVRRSKQVVWHVPCDSDRKAKCLASKWVHGCRLPV